MMPIHKHDEKYKMTKLHYVLTWGRESIFLNIILDGFTKSLIPSIPSLHQLTFAKLEVQWK